MSQNQSSNTPVAPAPTDPTKAAVEQVVATATKPAEAAKTV